jgi:hypothetical protein
VYGVCAAGSAIYAATDAGLSIVRCRNRHKRQAVTSWEGCEQRRTPPTHDAARGWLASMKKPDAWTLPGEGIGASHGTGFRPDANSMIASCLERAADDGSLLDVTLAAAIVNVPINVWHADHNIGDRDAVVVNFPTTPYDHAAPDKWRLPIDTPLIPHAFPAGTIGG